MFLRSWKPVHPLDAETTLLLENFVGTRGKKHTEITLHVARSKKIDSFWKALQVWTLDSQPAVINYFIFQNFRREANNSKKSRGVKSKRWWRVKAPVLGLLLILIQIGENYMNNLHTQFTYVPRDWTLVCLNIFKALEIKVFSEFDQSFFYHDPIVSPWQRPRERGRGRVRSGGGRRGGNFHGGRPGSGVRPGDLHSGELNI